MQRHVTTRMLGVDGGRVVRTVTFCVLAGALLIGAAWSGFGRWGLTVGLAVAGVLCVVFAGLAASKERPDGSA